MPIVPGNPQFPMQYGFNGTQPYTTQLNYREMIGEVKLWNPDADPFLIGRWINNNYRRIIERRNWYGLFTRGQINTPQMTTGGQAQVTNGSTSVQGLGTTWTPAVIGQQFRIGFTNPFQMIVDLDQANQVLTLDIPYGAQSITSGYQIAQVWVTLGANVRYIVDAVNQQQGWRMFTNVPQQTLNEVDTWRTNVGWSYALSSKEPTPDGQLQVEIYPSPFFLQVFPYLAITQPPNLVNDADSPVAFIRSDVLVSMTIADALVFRGKQNKYYDPQTAQMKKAEAEVELQKMEKNDDGMYSQDSVWNYGEEWGSGNYGSIFDQNHPVSAGRW